MENLIFKTIGSAPDLASEVVKNAKKLADFFEGEISGRKATEIQANSICQDFVERHDIKAVYHSGTFMGFHYPEAAEEEFETFKKK